MVNVIVMRSVDSKVLEAIFLNVTQLFEVVVLSYSRNALWLVSGPREDKVDCSRDYISLS